MTKEEVIKIIRDINKIDDSIADDFRKQYGKQWHEKDSWYQKLIVYPTHCYLMKAIITLKNEGKALWGEDWFTNTLGSPEYRSGHSIDENGNCNMGCC